MLDAQLEKQGRVKRPHVGMKLLELNAANAAQLRARDASFPRVSAGILVPAVTPESPAAAAGLRAGDVIIGDVPTHPPPSLLHLLSLHGRPACRCIPTWLCRPGISGMLHRSIGQPLPFGPGKPMILHSPRLGLGGLS